MADVSIKATITGAAEAQSALEGLFSAQQKLNMEQQLGASATASMIRMGEEHQRELAARAAATQNLKDHTNELIQKFNEQATATATAKAVGEGMAESLGRMALNATLSVVSIGTLVEGLRQIVSAGREADLSQVKLEATLKATGNAVGFTAKQLSEMADTLTQGTRIESTAMREAMGVLLTFENLHGEVFTRAATAAMNLSERYGMDLSSASMLLGRALQEPERGFSALERRIGTLDPVLRKHIIDTAESGRVDEARGMLLDILDGKFKDFAKTIGESAPASADRAKVALHGLFEELGKGSDGGFWSTLEKRFKDMSEWVKTDTERAGNINFLFGVTMNPDKFSAEAVAEAERQLAVMRAKAASDAASEKQKQDVATSAAQTRTDEEALAKRTAYNEKMARLAEAQQRKDVAEYDAGVRTRLSLMDVEIKQGELTHADKIAFIDSELEAQKAAGNEGSAFYVYLQKEREKQLEEASKFELDLYKVVAAARENVDKEGAKFRAQGVVEDKAVAAEHAKEVTQNIDDEIAQIRHMVFETNDLRINALQQLIDKHHELGDAGEKDYNRIRQAIRAVPTEAELMQQGLSRAFGRAGADIVSVAGSIMSSWSKTFADIIRGTTSLTDGIKGLWKGMVDAMINELGRLAARSLLQMASGALGLTSGGSGGLFSGLGNLGSGGAGGGGFNLGNLFGGGAEGSSGLTASGDIAIPAGAGMVPDLGGGFNLSSIFGGSGGATSGLSSVLAYAPAVMQLMKGNPLGAATSAAGTFIGTALGGPLGGAIGGFIGGMVGGGHTGHYTTLQGFDVSGAASLAGFAGTVTAIDDLGNRWAAPDIANVNATAAWVMGLGTPGNQTFPISMHVAGGSQDLYNAVFATLMHDVGAIGFAAGGSQVVTSPTLFKAGEAGPERVSVSPLAGGARASGGITNHFHGPTIMDSYSMILWLRSQQRMLQAAG